MLAQSGLPTCPVCAEGIRHSCIENRHIEVCHQCTVTWSPWKQYQCPNCFPTPGEGAIWDHYYMVDWFLDYQGRVPVSEDDDETISDSGSHKGAVDSDVLQAAHALIELNTEWRQAEINRPMGVASLKYSKASQAEIRHALECIQNPRNRRTRKGKTPAAILARDRELAIEKYVKLIYKTVPPGENEVETAVKRIQVLMSEPRNELTDAVKAIRVVKDECQNLTGHDYWARY